MRRLVIFIIFIIFFQTIIFSEALNDYTFIKIKEIKVGKEEGLIGWEPPYAGAIAQPKTFIITKNNTIIIPDLANCRLNVYNTNLDYIKVIIEDTDKYITESKRLIVDDNENIIGLIHLFGLKKINLKGKKIYTILRKELPEEAINWQNIFPINDILMIYNDNNGIEYITLDGEIIKDEKVTKKKEELTENKRKMKNEQVIDITLPSDKVKIIDDLRKDPSKLLIDDEFYSASYYETKKYFDKIKEVREYVKAQKIKNNYKYRTSNINIDIDTYDFTFIDYDKNHNSYWKAGKDEESIRKSAIIIFTKYGELLDAFYYGQYSKIDGSLKPDYTIYPTSGAEVAISPDGDIYFLRPPIVTLSKATVESPVPQVISGEMVYAFYKVERQW